MPLNLKLMWKMPNPPSGKTLKATKGCMNASTAFKKTINMHYSHEDAPKRKVGIRSSSKAQLDCMDFRKGLLNFVVLNKIIFWLSM